MSENPYWEVTLVRSSDLQSIGLLRYPFSFTPIFNRAGTFNTTLPLDDEIAYKVVKHATGVSCERNGEVIWSGSNVSIARDPAAMTLTINALGWLDELNHRFVRSGEESSLIFNSIAGGAIVQSLLGVVNNQLDTSNVARPTHLGFDSYQDTQVRTRSYKRGQNYGQALQELVDVENGLDIFVNPSSRLITTRAPTAYEDRTGVLFGYGVEPFNLANAPQSDDGTNTANRVTAVASNGITVPADDSSAIVAAGVMLESWESLSSDLSSEIVGAYANAELVYRQFGQVTYDLKPLPYANVPRLYDDFDLGDKVYLAIDAGALKVENQAMRVFSVTIEVDEQGNEVISSIGVAPQ